MVKVIKKADIIPKPPPVEVGASPDIARCELEFIAEKVKYYRAKAINNPQLMKEFEQFKSVVCGILV